MERWECQVAGSQRCRAAKKAKFGPGDLGRQKSGPGAVHKSALKGYRLSWLRCDEICKRVPHTTSIHGWAKDYMACSCLGAVQTVHFYAAWCATLIWGDKSVVRRVLQLWIIGKQRWNPKSGTGLLVLFKIQSDKCNTFFNSSAGHSFRPCITVGKRESKSLFLVHEQQQHEEMVHEEVDSMAGNSYHIALKIWHRYLTDTNSHLSKNRLSDSTTPSPLGWVTRSEKSAFSKNPISSKL